MDRSHSTLGDVSPLEFEEKIWLLKMSVQYSVTGQFESVNYVNKDRILAHEFVYQISRTGIDVHTDDPELLITPSAAGTHIESTNWEELNARF